MEQSREEARREQQIIGDYCGDGGGGDGVDHCVSDGGGDDGGDYDGGGGQGIIGDCDDNDVGDCCHDGSGNVDVDGSMRSADDYSYL